MPDYLNRFLKSNSWSLIGIVLALAVGILAPYQEQWLGAESVGVLIGTSIAFGLLSAFMIAGNLRKGGLPDQVAIFVLVVPIVIAWLMRHSAPLTAKTFTIPAIIFPTLTNEQILVGLAGIVVIVLVVAMGRAFARGETVAVESHWGGLGGGIGGWSLSPPLIYLVGIVIVIGATAWQITTPGQKSETAPNAPGQVQGTAVPPAAQTPPKSTEPLAKPEGR